LKACGTVRERVLTGARQQDLVAAGVLLHERRDVVDLKAANSGKSSSYGDGDKSFQVEQGQI
jgi:hypothetical protein